MDKKVRWAAIVFAFLLLSFFGSLVPLNVASAQAQKETVTRDFYVIAGYWMVPTPPPPASSPPGFQFTFESFRGSSKISENEVYDFGNLTYDPGKTWLNHGSAGSGWGNAWVKMNITNLLGSNIVITNLTAEVTAGTPTNTFFLTPSGMLFGNFTLVHVDTLDPWDPAYLTIDECDYIAGRVDNVVDAREIDSYTMAVGTPFPETDQIGPSSLLEPDINGDAVATRHVAPITLLNGYTFTEYFGIEIFGDIDWGAQIDGTITLRLTYELRPTGLSVEPWYIVNPQLGDTFLVNITVTNVTLWDFEFKLWYNSALMNATDIMPGPALNRTDYLETVKNLTVPGRVWYSGNLTTPPALDVTNTETIAIINFTALEAGKSELFLNETVVRAMVDTTVVDRPHWFGYADVTVVPEFSATALALLFLAATLATVFMGKKVRSKKRKDFLTAE